MTEIEGGWGCPLGKGPRIESRFEMAEEDTDWSYSETVPTLSKTMQP